MGTLKTIVGKTLRDIGPSHKIQEQCKEQKVHKNEKKRMTWVNRMTNDRLPKKARDNTPRGERRIRRSPKRWKQS